ncbi:MAG: hypothetical protein EBS55_14045, partial [Flavobacteriaceae bacterium]|nr:hypothetical protein [Flavobacteriaceae bacterium]
TVGLNVLPDFDPGQKINWGDESSESDSGESKNKENDQKESESDGSTNKNSESGGDKDSQKTESGNDLGACLSGIISAIQEAYNEESKDYFFRPYAVSAWTSIFTFLILHDKEQKAVNDFFGDKITDKKSWWFGNVTSELSKHISITKDGKKISLIEALEKGQTLESIKAAVISETKDKDKKNQINVAFQLLQKVRPELKQATIDNDNRFNWYDETAETLYEISVNPDFGVGDVKIPEGAWNSDSVQKWQENLKALQSKISGLKSDVVWGMIKTLTLYIDGLFQEGSKEIWKKFKGTFNDDDTAAANWLKTQKNWITTNILNPLKEKIKTFKYSDPDELAYYTREIDRIGTELLGGIIKKMEGNFDLYDKVEFLIQSFNKKDRVYIEVDTDF